MHPRALALAPPSLLRPTPSAPLRSAAARAPDTSSCKACAAGWACPQTGTAALTVPCAQGSYCTAGSAAASGALCAPGRYTDATNASAAVDCAACPRGFACAAGTGGPNAPQACPAGWFCPPGTGSAVASAGNRVSLLASVLSTCPVYSYVATGQTYSAMCACPKGTFSQSLLLFSAQQCTPCPAGSFCLGSGTAGVDGVCPAGRYCPQGTAAPLNCTAGSYSGATGLRRQEECLVCPVGQWCAAGASAPTNCTAGTFNPVTGGASAAGACAACPEGYTCPSARTSVPTPCGAGFYSSASSSAAACVACPKGRFCASNTTRATEVLALSATSPVACPQRMFCNGGVSVIPSLADYPCPSGFYCPLGTNATVPCGSGTHGGGLTGLGSQADCTICERAHELRRRRNRPRRRRRLVRTARADVSAFAAHARHLPNPQARLASTAAASARRSPTACVRPV